MALVFEIEYLSGVSFAALGPDTDAPEWPPQPDRVFSALTASWAARGRDEEEAQALEWLEQQPPPLIDASDAPARSAPTVFVPPNDPSIGKVKTAKHVLPSMRQRQARRFPAARPVDSSVRLLWDVEDPDEVILNALQRVAHDVAYVGHSASLTRCRFLRGAEVEPRNGLQAPHRRVYRGRLAELDREYEAGRRPQPGAPVRIATEDAPPRRGVFSVRWLILEHIDGVMPDVRAAAIVSRTIRETLMSGYRRTGLEAAIPEIVSGHTPGGEPSRSPHLAIVPMPFAGYPFADGSVKGLALVPPEGGEILDDADFKRALRAVAPLDPDRGRRLMTVRSGDSHSGVSFSIVLAPSFEPPTGKRSLDARPYTGSGRDFATVTPIVLDRHLKEYGAGRNEEIAAQIAGACRNIGLPEPELVIPDKHATFEGMPSAYPSGRNPAWMRWKLPRSLMSRQVTHAFIRFPVAIVGPVLLGAGRFLGMGLCRSINP